jgi:HlyD family secretion protein
MKRLGLSVAFPLLALCLGCNDTRSKDFLGSAIVETQTFQVATTASGALVAVTKQEGQRIKTGELLAVVDTVQIILGLQELAATGAELDASIAASKASLGSLSEDLKGVEREFNRVNDLANKGAAPTQQRDNLQTQYASARPRLQAGQQQLLSLLMRRRGLAVKSEELKNQLSKCCVYAPCNGTILTRYKNLGEVILPGNPIYEAGNYDSIQADFFVPQPQLSGLTLGQNVRIRLDAGNAEKSKFVPAQISWISEDAEFSPKNIQTRESRNELVFKVRALATNSQGLLKRGLPVEIWR